MCCRSPKRLVDVLRKAGPPERNPARTERPARPLPQQRAIEPPSKTGGAPTSLPTSKPARRFGAHLRSGSAAYNRPTARSVPRPRRTPLTAKPPPRVFLAVRSYETACDAIPVRCAARRGPNRSAADAPNRPVEPAISAYPHPAPRAARHAALEFVAQQISPARGFHGIEREHRQPDGETAARKERQWRRAQGIGRGGRP